MAPMTLYGTPAIEAAREYPFSSLLGSPVQVLACEDLYASTAEWNARWPGVRRRADCGVFLDHLGGWVARGTFVEVSHLLADGKPVWWFNSGEPTGRFGFGPPRHGDWRLRHRRVGLGYGRPCVAARHRPLAPERAGERRS